MTVTSFQASVLSGQERPLSRRQEGLLAFIKSYYRAHLFPPAIRDMQVGADISSPSVVFWNLQRLARLGLIRLGGDFVGQTRTAVPVWQPGEPCPLCGCGEPHADVNEFQENGGGA